MSIARHTAANIVGGVAPLVVALLTVPVFLHHVGTERYGVLAVLWTLLAYFTFFDFGFGRAVAQRMSKLADASPQARSDLLWTAIGATAALGLIGSLLLWLSTDLLLQHVVQLSEESRREARGAIAWLVPALPVVLLGSLFRGALQARLRFFELNAIEVLTSILTQVLPMVVALLGVTSLEVLVPVTLSVRMVSAACLLLVAGRHVPLHSKPAFRPEDVLHLAKYGGWITLMSIVVPLLVTVDRLVIAATSGAAQVPYYTVPFDLVTKAMIITTSVSGALFPRLAANTGEDASVLAGKATASLVAFFTPVIIVGMFAVHPFMRLWVGEHFAASSFGVPEILMIGVWLNTWCAIHQSFLLGRDNPRPLVLVYALELPLYLAMLWMGLHFGGLLGAGSAWSLRILLETMIVLRMAGALRSTILSCVPPLILVLASLGVVLTTPASSPLHWALGALLLAVAVFSRRGAIVSGFAALVEKGRDTSSPDSGAVSRRISSESPASPAELPCPGDEAKASSPPKALASASR